MPETTVVKPAPEDMQPVGEEVGIAISKDVAPFATATPPPPVISGPEIALAKDAIPITSVMPLGTVGGMQVEDKQLTETEAKSLKGSANSSAVWTQWRSYIVQQRRNFQG